MHVSPRQQDSERSGRGVVLAGVVAVVLLGGYLGLGMPGMDHSGESMAEMDHNSSVDLRALSPRKFEARISDGDSFVVNVHVPVDDRIVGTDESIAFDAIVASGRLPADKGKSILLYCESGRMSDTAGRALVEAGYTDVGHLAGGLEAWRRAGLELVPQPQLAR